jgi:hypothetical protein
LPAHSGLTCVPANAPPHSAAATPPSVRGSPPSEESPKVAAAEGPKPSSAPARTRQGIAFQCGLCPCGGRDEGDSQQKQARGVRPRQTASEERAAKKRRQHKIAVGGDLTAKPRSSAAHPTRKIGRSPPALQPALSYCLPPPAPPRTTPHAPARAPPLPPPPPGAAAAHLAAAATAPPPRPPRPPRRRRCPRRPRRRRGRRGWRAPAGLRR